VLCRYNIQKIVCEKLCGILGKKPGRDIPLQAKFVRARVIGGVYFCALQRAKFSGVKKFLSSKQAIFLNFI